MSSYKPTFLGSDRWLRNGIPLDAVKLDAELSLLAASISTIGGETGAANHTFEAGYGIRDSPLDKASGKWWAPRYDESNDAVAIPLATVGKSDSVFSVVKFPTKSKYFGCRWLNLAIGGPVGAGAPGGGVGHPLYSLYNPAPALIVPDAANRPPLTTANDGESIFAFAPDMEMALNAPPSYEAFIRIRNIDQSVAFRYGTSMTFGAATAAGANVLRIRVVSAEF